MKNTLLYFVLLALINPYLIAADAQNTEKRALWVAGDQCHDHQYHIYPVLDPDFVTIKEHHQKNKEKIIEKIAPVSGGRLLILGVGAGFDLPLEWLINKFDYIVMVDAYIKPMEEYLEKLSKKDPAIKAKVQLVKMDLSGGVFAKMLDARKFQIAVTSDYHDREKNGQSTPNVEEFFQGLTLNLAQYKPDIIISSLVASSVVALAFEIQEKPIYILINSLALLETMGLAPQGYCNDMLKYYGNIVMPKCKALFLQSFLAGILQCKASFVYFSDTAVQKFDKKVFTDFKQAFQSEYQVESNDDAWHYRPDLSVSWYAFAKGSNQ